MLKYFVSILMIMFVFNLFGESFTSKLIITKDCHLRGRPDRNSVVRGRIVKSDGLYDILDTFGYYTKVSLTDNKTKKEYTGWIWNNAIKESRIIGKGATLRNIPKKNANTVIAYIHPDSLITKSYEDQIVWYKVRPCFGDKCKEGWVWSGAVKVVR